MYKKKYQNKRKKYKLIRDMSFNDSTKTDHSLKVLKEGSVYHSLYFKEYDRLSREIFFRNKKEGKKVVILMAEGVQRKFVLGEDVEELN